MRYLPKLVAVLGVCAHSAFAAETAISQMTNWHISPITNVAANPYCIMAARFDNGLIMTFARNNQNQYSLGVDAGQPYFDAGLSYALKLQIGQQTRELAAKASNQNLVVANLGADTNLFDVLSRGQTLHVVVANNVIDQYIQAKPQAFFELAHCWQGLPKPVAANVPVAKALPLPPSAALKTEAPLGVVKTPTPVRVTKPTTSQLSAPKQSGQTVLPMGQSPIQKSASQPKPTITAPTTPARDVLADVLAKSRAEAAQTDKLNKQEATMAQKPLTAPVAADILNTKKLAAPVVSPPIAHAIPAPIDGPRQKLATTDEEKQLAKVVEPPSYTKQQAALPLANTKRTQLVFDKPPEQVTSPLAPLVPKPTSTAPSPAINTTSPATLKQTSAVLQQWGVKDKIDASRKTITFDAPQFDNVTMVASTHSLAAGQDLASFAKARAAKARQVCGANNFNASVGPAEKTTDNRTELTMQTTCRKSSASTLSLYEQAGSTVRQWQMMSDTEAQANLVSAKTALQKLLPTVHPMGKIVLQPPKVN